MKAITRIIGLILLCLAYLANQGVWAEETQTLSLEDCIKIALSNSFEVKLARLDFLIEETEMTKENAIYDTLLAFDISYEKDNRQPLSTFGADEAQTNIYSVEATKTLTSGTELTLSVSDERTWTNSAYTSTNPAHTAEASLEARQPLGKNVFGYIDRRNITVTSLAIQNADLDTKERIESLLGEVEAAYWEWVFSKRNSEIYRQLLEKAQDLHRSNIDNYKLGNVEKADFLASRVNVLLREKDVQIADNKYSHAEGKIKLLMNVDAAWPIRSRESLEYRKLEVELEDCLKKAFQKRRDYLQAKREVEMKKIVLETKVNARWPEIDLIASFAANGIDSGLGRALNNIVTDNNSDYYAGLEVTIPIENNLARGEFKKAEYDKEKALVTLKSIERSIITETGSKFRDYATYKANADKVIEVAKLQYEKLKEEEKWFRYGRFNTRRLIDSQEDYLNAQLQLALGMLDLELGRVNLEKTLNLILEKYEGLL